MDELQKDWDGGRRELCLSDQQKKQWNEENILFCPTTRHFDSVFSHPGFVHIP